MKRVILKSFADRNTGEIGLGIKGMSRNDDTNAATEGLLIAHDLIEHVNGPSKIGTIDDELEALGAIWYVRGQHGQLSRDGRGSMYTIAQNIAGDITRMFHNYICGSHVFLEKLRTCAVLHDDDLQDTLQAADKSYRGEFSNGEPEFNEAVEKWPAYRTLCLHRMRVGYRKATRKWAKHGQYAANNQFWAIAEAVGPHIRGLETEGLTFVLRYGDGEATCEEQYEEAY